MFGLGNTRAGVYATAVSLIARGGSIGDDTGGNAAPVVVSADSVSVLSSGELRVTSPTTIADLTLNQFNTNLAPGSVWAITTPDFALSGVADSNGVLGVAAVAGATTNLEVDSSSGLTVGTLSLGSGSLNLNAYNQGAGTNSINSDGSNGSDANIITTGGVTLNAYSGIGDLAQIKTDIGGDVSLTTFYGGIDLAQISGKPLILTNLAANNCCTTNPISVTSAGDMTLINGLSSGGGGDSVVTLTAGGDINYSGTTLTLYGSPIVLAAGGSINGGAIYGASGASLTAAGTTQGSTGSVSIGNIDGYYYWSPASAAITVQAAGDVNISGRLISSDSVSITSSNGSIYGQSDGTFSLTPTVNLDAHGDIGAGSGGSVGQWALTGSYNDNPGTLTLSAQAGGAIDLMSYAAVNATQLTGGGSVSLQVLGDGWHTGNVGLTFGQVSSTNGSVYLGTANGDIVAASGSSAIDAATSITLNAAQSSYFYDSGTTITQAFNLGSVDAPLVLTAPQLDLTANGNIYATVSATGLTDLSVNRTYVPYDSRSNQAVLMPASTVLIESTDMTPVLAVADDGWAQGGLSSVSSSYDTPLNLSYSANNAIKLDTVNLHGGDLALQATNPYDISITSTGSLIQANAFSFNLVDGNQIDGTDGVATGGFGTAANPIHTEIASLSGATVGATAGVFIEQDGPIAFANLTTGGAIVGHDDAAGWRALRQRRYLDRPRDQYGGFRQLHGVTAPSWQPTRQLPHHRGKWTVE